LYWIKINNNNNNNNMSKHCFDYSFGLVPKDLQVNNAKVNEKLVACDAIEESTTTIPIIASVQTRLSENFGPAPILVSWDQNIEINPPSFKTSDTTFTIPENGLYTVNVTVSVTEFAGAVAADAGLMLMINGLDTAFMNYRTIPGNQSGVLVGSATYSFSKNDTISMKIGCIFGSSADIQYVGNVSGFNLSRLAIIKVV